MGRNVAGWQRRAGGHKGQKGEAARVDLEQGQHALGNIDREDTLMSGNEIAPISCAGKYVRVTGAVAAGETDCLASLRPAAGNVDLSARHLQWRPCQHAMIVIKAAILRGSQVCGDLRESVRTYVELGLALAIGTVQGCGELKEGSPSVNRSGMFDGSAGREASAA